MDAKDVRIFCEMAFGSSRSVSTVQDRHVSPSNIGRSVGLDEKTVRLRIKKMEDDGFIKHYQVVPNLSLLGLANTGLYRFEALNLYTKRKVVDYTHEVSSANILETNDYLGMSVSMNFAGLSAEAVQKSADSITSRFELGRWGLQMLPVRRCPHKMDRLDWQIVKGLRYSARRSTTDLSKSLSITTRMAEYRMQKMMDSGAIFVKASIDPRKQTGLVFYELELTVEEPDQNAVARTMTEKFGDRLWSTLASGRIILVNLFGFSLGEPEDAAIDAGRLQGVKSCALYVLKESIEPRGPNWIDKAIEDRLDSIKQKAN